ncbi:fork head domain-containing protein [Drepanopeziza brunnea f. sp. 'multigermtubi' MB_m1]|uniref:Fork head domain-containing protein n=1 Tax=Marssonina brunnea f. sp. multigermtubi (strain MB_m1) TaxID=1072389 RepID=K1W7J7_MARBU|nr:fork head domain-containing protein [Drepanopeziza brunnea f. sp. 'multigermtubi' MB_m1]EKD13060.1 fork head domain-containing protein [Drepanopeziza brunnea f. sp. 'multigermtubi' MB_m1]
MSATSSLDRIPSSGHLDAQHEGATDTMSTKRSARARREVNKEVDIPDSSPSRPAKKRKKEKVVEEPVEKDATPEPIAAPEPEPLPTDRAGIPMDDDKLIEAVVPFLLMPERMVQVAEDHSNEKFKESENQQVTAYAKLAGKDWSFYVTMVKIVLGRPPEGESSVPAGTLNGADETKSAKEIGVHIDLGPNKVVSRSHAEIYFDSDSESWWLLVCGRNGVKIDDKAYRRGERKVLVNGEVIEIGGVEMMWVMPTANGSLRVHDKFLQRAGLIQAADDDKTQDGSMGSASSGHFQMPNGQLAIAPAPYGYRRPGTPTMFGGKMPYLAGKSPGYYGGTMLMEPKETNYSLEQNSHMKPLFSYSQLISQAILDAEGEKLTLAGIYNFITDRYAYYRAQVPSGWQNSIRHNLSLNKAFGKVARETDEPGKGMKWHIVPEMYEEMVRTCWRGGRGGHRGSPGTGSPAAFSGARKDPTQKTKRSPPSGSPALSSYPSTGPQMTPDRGGPQLPRPAEEDVPGDGSPLPRHKRPAGNSFGLSDNAPGSPTLSSSMVHEDSFVTPAPHRVHPRLAPPSTAQRPSQHMPTSSPAPFWKYADIGSTPMRAPAFDLSPVKGSAGPLLPPSSSPAPVRRVSAASPTRNSMPVKQDIPEDLEDDEDQGFDLARGFQSISSFHAPAPTVAGTGRP